MRVLPVFILMLIASTATAAPQVYKEEIRPHWDESGDRFWYRNDLPGATHEFILVDAAARSRGPAFDHERAAKVLSDVTNLEVRPDALPFEEIRIAENGASVDLLGSELSWRLDLETYALEELAEGSGFESIPFDRTIRNSRYLGGETFVTFLNRRDETVRVFWIDGSGGRHQYAELEPGGRHRQHTYTGHCWLVLGPADEIIAVFEAPAEPGLALIDDREPDRIATAPERATTLTVSVPSPDGRWAVFVRDHNLWRRDLQSGEEAAISFDGAAGDTYTMDTQRDRLVEMEYDRVAEPDSMPDVLWAPDSHYVMARRTRAVTPRVVTMVEAAPRDQVQPRVHTYPYLKPGDDIPVSLPHLFDVDAGKEIPLDNTLFVNPWDIYDYHWAADGGRLFFLYNQRGHQTMRVLAVEAATGKVTAVVDETSATFFDYQGKTFLEQIDGTDELIWMSERDGWNHLYLYDRRRSKVKKQITEGEWAVRWVEKVDSEKRQILFAAGGLVPGQDPYYVQFCRVDFDGRNFTVLTEGDGTHEVQWSPDGRWFIDTWSRVDAPPVHVLRSGNDGTLAVELETADASEVLATGRTFPEPFLAKGRDEQTDIFGIIHRPTEFDPQASYPVLEAIYAGPHGFHVPKGFRGTYRLQELADRGFVIVQIDGMGTSWRNKGFHDVCWQNLADAGFPDRIAWIKAAAAEYPYLDLDRVGIYGGSAGGQNALGAMLTHGDFYKAAMADCGCHDNRMDKIWWNEQWMGYPVGPHYAAQSNVTLAPNLEGALLLIVGELDRNVDPASTMQVVDALVRADKDFEMLVLPGVGHGASGTAYGRRRTADFFVRTLIETE